MFAFFLVCQQTNNQTTKEKCKLAFKGTRVIKNKRLCLIEIKHTGNHIYVIICLQTNTQTYEITCNLVSKLTKKNRNVKSDCKQRNM